MAPSRPIPAPVKAAVGLYRARSHSEPNIPELFHGDKDRENDEPELSFLEEGGMVTGAGDTHLLHVSSNHLDEGGKGLISTPQHLSARSLTRFPPQSTPIDKSESIRHFLASLPNVTVEDDPGLGDNMCTSESGSGYSSPISTPTDDDHLHSRYNKLAKEIRREHRAASSEHHPVKGGHGDQGEDGGSEGRQKESREEKSAQKPPLPPGSACESGSSRAVSSSVSESRPASSSHTEDTRNEAHGMASGDRSHPVAHIPIFQGIPKPLRSSSLPRSIVAQYHQEEEGGGPGQGEGQPATLDTSDPPPPPHEAGSLDAMSESLLAEHGSTSVSVSESNYETAPSPSEPIGQQKFATAKPDPPPETRPPPETASGLVELPQIQSVPERIKEIEEMHSLKTSRSPTVPPLEASISQPPPEKKERRDPEDTPSIPAPETNSDDNNRRSGEMTRTSSGHSITSSLSAGEEEAELKELTSLNENGNSNNDSKVLHMVPLRHASLSPNPAPITQSAGPESPDPAALHVRTASCSHIPSSSSPGSAGGAPDHAPLQPEPGSKTVLVQPGSGAVKARVLDIEERRRDRGERSVSTDEMLARRQSPPFQQRAASAATTEELLMRRQSPPFQQERATSSPLSDEMLVRRQSSPPPLLQQRASSSSPAKEIPTRRHSTPPLQQRPSSSTGDMLTACRQSPSSSSSSGRALASMSSPKAQDLKQLIMAQQRRPSSEIIQECTASPGSHVRRETTPPAFLSAWSRLVDEIPSTPVQDLKKKFEDSDAVSLGSSLGSGASIGLQREVKKVKSNLRRTQSLKAVDSPGKGRHRFKVLKKWQGFGGSPGGRRASSPSSQD